MMSYIMPLRHIYNHYKFYVTKEGKTLAKKQSVLIKQKTQMDASDIPNSDLDIAGSGINGDPPVKGETFHESLLNQRMRYEE